MEGPSLICGHLYSWARWYINVLPPVLPRAATELGFLCSTRSHEHIQSKTCAGLVLRFARQGPVTMDQSMSSSWQSNMMRSIQGAPPIISLSYNSNNHGLWMFMALATKVTRVLGYRREQNRIMWFFWWMFITMTDGFSPPCQMITATKCLTSNK